MPRGACLTTCPILRFWKRVTRASNRAKLKGIIVAILCIPQSPHPRAVMLNREQFCPSGDNGPGLKTLLAVFTREEVLPASSG